LWILIYVEEHMLGSNQINRLTSVKKKSGAITNGLTTALQSNKHGVGQIVIWYSASSLTLRTEEQKKHHEQSSKAHGKSLSLEARAESSARSALVLATGSVYLAGRRWHRLRRPLAVKNKKLRILPAGVQASSFGDQPARGNCFVV
jgi:hypothetical protein